jgi:hypothetical protein
MKMFLQSSSALKRSELQLLQLKRAGEETAGVASLNQQKGWGRGPGRSSVADYKCGAKHMMIASSSQLWRFCSGRLAVHNAWRAAVQKEVPRSPPACHAARIISSNMSMVC